MATQEGTMHADTAANQRETGRRGSQRGKTKSEHGRFPCFDRTSFGNGKASDASSRALLAGNSSRGSIMRGEREMGKDGKGKKKAHGKVPVGLESL